MIREGRALEVASTILHESPEGVENALPVWGAGRRALAAYLRGDADAYVPNATQSVLELMGLRLACRSNCFPTDTLVGTETGLRPIAEVEAGERVWAYDFQGGTWRLCEVECRHDADYDGPLVTLDMGVGEVTATAYHPFWVVEGEDLESRPALRHVAVNEDRGESLPGRWVNSHDLREGDVVFLRGNGPATVRRVKRRHKRTPVCNLTVHGLHTFAVGQAQVLVHNTSGSSRPRQRPTNAPYIPRKDAGHFR